MKLTIAIPTFNRNRQLRNCLERLVPQLTPECFLMILDNHSDTPIIETVRDLLDPLPPDHYSIIRNPANIGGVANMVRCFELTPTEWMWQLSDDDPPRLDAVANILKAIEEHPEAMFQHFVCGDSYQRDGVTVATGLDQLIEMDREYRLIVMSVCVYRIPSMRQVLRFGYHYAYSWASQLAILFAAIGKDGRAVFRPEVIVDPNSEYSPNNTWCKTDYALGAMSLLDLPMSHATRIALARRIFRSIPSVERLAAGLLAQAVQTGDAATARYFFDQIVARAHYFNPSPFLGVKAFLYRKAFFSPRLSLSLYHRFYRLLKGRSQVTFEERFTRM